ncbi:MAG: 16S rRNA (guanine(527)-N(7))-methyltransferase RsmG [Nocardioidaceae bacterium]
MSTNVSRETPAPPPGAQQLFGPRWPKLLRYAELLTTEGTVRGLIGPGETTRLWDRHILNCAQIAPAFGQDISVCDIGSGAGLPGVVLALARPDLEVTLLEPRKRRSAFLEEVVEDLALPDVQVVRARAEELGGAGFDAAVARAVAPLDRLARWALPLCRPGGTLVAMKGTAAKAELASARETLDRLGVRSARVRELSISPEWSGVLAVEVVAGETVRAGAGRRRRRG